MAKYPTVEEVDALLLLERTRFYDLLDHSPHAGLLSNLRTEKNSVREFRRFMNLCMNNWFRLNRLVPGQPHWLVIDCFRPYDVLRLYVAQEGVCRYCGAALGSKFHVDHLEPLSLSLDNSKTNICLACVTCNCRKRTLSPEQFQKRLLEAR